MPHKLSVILHKILSTTSTGTNHRPKTCWLDNRRYFIHPVFYLETDLHWNLPLVGFLAATLAFTSVLIVVTHKTNKVHTNYILQTHQMSQIFHVSKSSFWYCSFTHLLTFSYRHHYQDFPPFPKQPNAICCHIIVWWCEKHERGVMFLHPHPQGMPLTVSSCS